MGLIKAAVSAVAGTMSDTWKDYFVCDSMGNETLMVKGVKKGQGLFDSGEVITNGSGIVVADGQCALIVDDGQILEVAAEPGNYTFDTSKSPSVFDGGMAGIKNTFSEMVERFTYGGTANKSQRVYYVNTKEITGNMFGTATPIPFRVVDKNINLDVDIAIRCNGEYSFRIVNPLLFYKNVAGNSAAKYSKDQLAAQMKTELMTALQYAFSKISEAGVRYSEVPAHTLELVDFLNEKLSDKWDDLRGMTVVSLGINSISASKEDEEMIKTLQKTAVNKDATMANATIVTATADAMRNAAANENGAGIGFMNMNMAAQAGGTNVNAFLNQSAQAPAGETWTCSCGTVCTGNFCPTCGKGKPQAAGFCPNCGKEVPVGSKFCPNCGKQL